MHYFIDALTILGGVGLLVSVVYLIVGILMLRLFK